MFCLKDKDAKKFVIVYEEKCKEFATYLSQLISSKDDTEDGIVGTEDGKVEATLWSEKDYKDNSQTLSSNQYRLFIGNDKLIKTVSAHMDIVFSKYEIKYGWCGRQAVISVEKALKTNMYEDFILFAQKYKKDVERVIKCRNTKKVKAGVAAGTAAAAAGAIKSAVSLASGPMVVGSGVFAALTALALSPIAGIGVGVMAVKNKKIIAQQYAFGVLKFYLDDLSRFLDMNDKSEKNKECEV